MAEPGSEADVSTQSLCRFLHVPLAQLLAEGRHASHTCLEAAPGPSGRAIVAGDTVRSFALQKMLRNRGISSLTVGPVQSKHVQRLQHALRASAVVGFEPNWHDMAERSRKLPPPGGPGGWWGVGGAAVSSPAIERSRKFPPPHGPGRPNPAGATIQPTGQPRLDAIRAKYWNWGQPWRPKGKAGGVNMNMGWTFVDKGDWPVATFFTLCYKPAPDAVAAEDRH